MLFCMSLKKYAGGNVELAVGYVGLTIKKEACAKHIRDLEVSSTSSRYG